ncbi:uncharacterized protein EV422DRAFT_563774 [Fimicolochytrium jonesii]|uniref:uncharacterized protein n=1 Tax=Fimicolochytrium jonesii TaxID=1396493 RepID=UPI0022FF3648|nr:uncharacterized protein EV422DRAFT_563774 [Fimicolochytrium jonesii]KAI8825958.1 hypothetical protein EV422DRAFT_563774 [Fimicolochytrium jonesii]
MFTLLQRWGPLPKAAPIWRLAAVRSLHATPVAFVPAQTLTKAEQAKKDIRKQLRAIGKPASVPPKKAHSSYLIFALELKDELYPTLAHLDSRARIGELGRLAGERWRALSQSEKEPYERRAAENKKQYDRDVKEYLANRTASDIVLEEKRFLLQKKLNPDAYVKKPLRDIDAPKLPLNPWFLFTKQAHALTADRQREILGTSLANLSLPEANQLLKTAFSKLSDEQKGKLEADYRKALKEYRAERDEYNRTSGKDVIVKEVKRIAKDAVKKPVGRRKKKVIKKKKPTLRLKKKARTAKKLLKPKTKKKAATKKSTATKKKPTAKKATTKKATATKKKTVTKKAAPKKAVTKKAALKKVAPKTKVAVRKA